MIGNFGIRTNTKISIFTDDKEAYSFVKEFYADTDRVSIFSPGEFSIINESDLILDYSLPLFPNPEEKKIILEVVQTLT